QVRRGDARIDDVALADAGALKDPFVVGLDQLFEVGVGEHSRRDVRREAGDARTRQRARRGVYHRRESLPGAVRPKYSYARDVATRPRGVRSRNPAWMRNGSWMSSMASFSSLIAAAMLLTPT